MSQSGPVKPTGQTHVTIPSELNEQPAFGAQAAQISK
jgi:hypothetical protein